MDTHNRKDHETSYIFACIILAVVIIITVMIFVKWLITSDSKVEDEFKYTRELFSGIKPNKLARGYYSMFLLRRLLFVLVIFSYFGIGAKIKIILIMALQMVYLCYVIVARPFIKIKDNIIDILNESCLTGLILLLLIRVNDTNWLESIRISYWAILIGSSIILVIISLGKVI